MTVSDGTIIHDLSAEIIHPYVSTLHGYLNLEPLLPRYQRHAHSKYLKRRDEYKSTQLSAEMSASAKWEGTTFHVANHLF